jgi:cysteine sulfinate desulfinase/cysteine desulfurase-like protein
MLAVFPYFNQDAFVIYLDRDATTPIRPEVPEAMMPFVTTEWGNPSSAARLRQSSRVPAKDLLLL